MGVLGLVGNPHSGRGHGLAVVHELVVRLGLAGHSARLLSFRSAAEVRRWAAEGRERFDALLCVGGDSTLSAVAPAAVRLGMPLVPVPTGFGNIFARTFGHRSDPGFVVDLLRRGQPRWVDVGQEEGGTLFLSSRSFGFLEGVKRAVERGAPPPAFRRRYLAYVRTALRAIRREPMPRIEVAVDGDLVATDAAMVVVANVPTYRGFLPLVPGASPFDGLLDVFLVERRSPAAMLALMAGFLLRAPGQGRRVRRLQGKRVTVRPRGAATEDLVALPRALPILIPLGGPGW